MSSKLRLSRRRRTHPRHGLMDVLGMLGVVAMFIALATAFTGRPVSANTEFCGVPTALGRPIFNADFPPGDIAGRWTGTLTLTEVKVYQDITIPDLLDDTKPPTVLTKEQCEAQLGSNLGKAQPITMDFQPQSPTSGQVQFLGSDSKPQIVPYQLLGDRTTMSLVDNDALAKQKGQVLARLQGQITVQGGNYVQAGPVEVTMGSEGATLLTMKGNWTVSKPAPPGTPDSAAAPTAAPVQKPGSEAPAKAVPPAAGQPASAPTSGAGSADAPGKAGDGSASGPFAGLPDFTKFIPSDLQKILKAPIPGMSGPGTIPGPKSLDEALAGILIPGLLGLGGLLAGGLLGGGGATAPPLTPPESKAPAGPKRPEGDGPKPLSPEEARRQEWAKRHEKTLKDIAKTQKEAADANSLSGLLKGTGSNAGQEMKDLGAKIVKGTGKVLEKGLEKTVDLAIAGKNLITDPAKAWDALKGTAKTVADGFTAAKDMAKAAGDALTKAGSWVWNNPGKAYDQAKDALKGAYDFVTNPKNVWDFLKSASGYKDFGEAMDPNKSLAERLAHVGMGVANLFTTITTAGAAGGILKTGASKVIATTSSTGTAILEKLGLTFGEKGLVKGAAGKALEAAAEKKAAESAMKTGVSSMVRKEGGTTLAGATEKTAAESAVKKTALKEGVNSDQLLSHRGGKSIVPDPKAVASTEGIPKSQLDKMQKLAKESGYDMAVRPPADEAGRLLESGAAVPKPPTVHNKSISAIDEMIGAPKGKRGLTGHFEPQLPPKGTVPEGMEEEVLKRFNDRRAEFVKNNEYLKGMEKKGFKVIDGVVHDVRSGVPKPLASDIDLAGIFKNGKPIPEDEARMFVKKIMKECPGVTHPDINVWYPTSKGDFEIMSKTMAGHALGAPGAKPLAILRPDGTIGAGFFEGLPPAPGGNAILL